jgi:hypothetical protein
MDLIDRLRELAAKASKQLPHLSTEEATKTALVMPFIQALGYNVFDPTEVMPEFTADVGTKKGEKVDYAILRDGKPVMLFECKWSGRSLDDEHASQLYRYFSVTAAKFGVLTNGLQYRIYSDLEQPNKMDSRPFLEFSLTDLTPQAVEEVKKFAKEGFDLENILSTASDLKYTKGIKRVLAEEAANPTEDLVRLLTGRVYSGRLTQAVREQFTRITRQAFQEFVSDRVSERLKTALEQEAGPGAPAAVEDPAPGEAEGGSVVTTEEERDAYYVVKAIVREVVDARRVVMRDAKSYCAILLDDNNRKPVCRLHFNTTQKYLGLLDAEKKETRHPIADVSDIYQFASQLKESARRYESHPGA